MAGAKSKPSRIEDVGTTERKRLTPTQRLALFERKKGICCVCGERIEGAFIDEHRRALGLGGSNAASNRDIAHKKCAALKTMADMAAINKAKRTKKAAHGIKRHAPPLQSRNDLPVSAKAEKRLKNRLPTPTTPSNLQRRYGIRDE